MEEHKNVYMEQVMREQAQVQADLGPGRKRRAAPIVQASVPQQAAGDVIQQITARRIVPMADELDGAAPAVDVRITGAWWWQRVIVPPNAYVVHTRFGHERPLHCGLGTSFRYNPRTDSFLVVPAAMQTISLSANSICKERQGILVQGYVQWTIGDFALAYKKLDFSDPLDPMRVVNVQLREQAEATIKDTVATMSIDQVLADKQPIIEELTSRLRILAEGDGKAEGLGLRIITVQIKEAVVSSSRLWESLQRPFRAERSRIARLAELEQEQAIQERESAAERARVARAIEAEQAQAALRDRAAAEAFDRAQAELVRRAEREAETLAATLAHQRERARQEAELQRARLQAELELTALRHEHELAQAERDLALEARRRQLDNEVSPARLQQQVIERLPELARELPRPEHATHYSFEGADRLGPLVRDLLALARPAEPAAKS